MGLPLRLSLGSHPKALSLKPCSRGRFSEAMDRLKHHEILVHQSAAQPTEAYRTATRRQLPPSLSKSLSHPCPPARTRL